STTPEKETNFRSAGRLSLWILVGILLAALSLAGSQSPIPPAVTSTEGGEKPPTPLDHHFPPPGPLMFSFFREPIPGLTTQRNNVYDGELVPITHQSLLRLTIESSGGEPGHTVSYAWEGAHPVTSGSFSSTAEFTGKRPGIYTIRVTPYLDGVARHPLHVRVRVFAIRPERIRVRMTDPPGAVTYVGHPFTCHGETEPAEFESLLEWSAPKHKVASGVGPSFTTSRDIVGDGYPIFAS